MHFPNSARSFVKAVGVVVAAHQLYHVKKEVQKRSDNLEIIKAEKTSFLSNHPDHVLFGYHGGQRPVEWTQKRDLYTTPVSAIAACYANKNPSGGYVSLVFLPKNTSLRIGSIKNDPKMLGDTPSFNRPNVENFDFFESSSTGVSGFFPYDKLNNLPLKVVSAPLLPINPNAVLFRFINQLGQFFI